jgi:hypothetical protein
MSLEDLRFRRGYVTSTLAQSQMSVRFDRTERNLDMAGLQREIFTFIFRMM